MKIVLYEKSSTADIKDFKPAANERLAWLLNFIANVEDDKEDAEIRLAALLSGEVVDTDFNSFVIRVE